jgi:hypothetical protein
MPDAVPLKVQRRIASVFAIRNPVLGRILDQDRLWLVQQWTNQFDGWVAGRRIAPLHPGEPFAAAATKQPEEEQLKLIIRMMRQGDTGNSPSPGGAGQEIMTQLARGHLQGKPVRDGQFPDVRPLYYHRQLEL